MTSVIPGIRSHRRVTPLPTQAPGARARHGRVAFWLLAFVFTTTMALFLAGAACPFSLARIATALSPDEA